MTRSAICLILVACGGRTHTGSGVMAPRRGAPVLADGRVFIPLTRDHYDEFHDDGGIASLFANDMARDETEVTKVEPVGTIVLDVRTGTCKLSRRASGQSRPPAWITPVSLARKRVTRSGVHVWSAGGLVHARSPTGEQRPIVRDPTLAAAYLPNTDAVVLDGRLIDAVDDEAFTYTVGVARVGDRMFAPTPRNGVLELTAAPITRVASHLPSSIVPVAKVTWLASTPWAVGETHRNVTLARDRNGTYLEAERWRILLSDKAVAVTVLEHERYAVADGIVVDLVERGTAKLPGNARVAEHGNELLIEAGGAFFLSTPSLGLVRPFEVELRVAGFEDGAFVLFTDDRDVIFVFELATRSWRELPFGSCMPAASRR